MKIGGTKEQELKQLKQEIKKRRKTSAKCKKLNDLKTDWIHCPIKSRLRMVQITQKIIVPSGRRPEPVESLKIQGGGHCVFKWILPRHLNPPPSATI